MNSGCPVWANRWHSHQLTLGHALQWKGWWGGTEDCTSGAERRLAYPDGIRCISGVLERDLSHGPSNGWGKEIFHSLYCEEWGLCLKMEKMMFLGKLNLFLFSIAWHVRKTGMGSLLSFVKWRLRDDNCMERRTHVQFPASTLWFTTTYDSSSSSDCRSWAFCLHSTGTRIIVML